MFMTPKSSSAGVEFIRCCVSKQKSSGLAQML